MIYSLNEGLFFTKNEDLSGDIKNINEFISKSLNSLNILIGILSDYNILFESALVEYQKSTHPQEHAKLMTKFNVECDIVENLFKSIDPKKLKINYYKNNKNQNTINLLNELRDKCSKNGEYYIKFEDVKNKFNNFISNSNRVSDSIINVNSLNINVKIMLKSLSNASDYVQDLMSYIKNEVMNSFIK